MVETFRDIPYAARHFRAIVNEARNNNPFYRRWITDPEDPPLLDRVTALEHNDEILNGNPVTGTTSGSISVPVRFSHSREWRMLARRDADRFVRMLGGPLPCVRIIHRADPRTDPLAVPVNTPIDDQIEFIVRHSRESGAVAITTLPTNAELLAEAILSRGIDMSFIRRFGTYAETLQEHQKNLIRKAFPNAKVWETYSALEFGIIATICPYEPDFFHIMAHRMGLETLREDGTPADHGEPGSVFITDYFNRQSPLIRYELGDLAVRGECPCGRIRLPALRTIVGRISGTLRRRDGSRMLFVDLSVALREIPGVKQYQVIQDGYEDFTVKISARKPVDRQVAEAFAAHLGYVPDNLQLRYMESIPREPTGKYRTSICNM